MRRLPLLFLALSLAFSCRGADCVIQTPPEPSLNRPLWFSSDTQTAKLLGCDGATCTEILKEMPVLDFLPKLANSLQVDLSSMNATVSCLEGELLKQDNRIRDLSRLTEDDKERLMARHAFTLQRTHEVRTQLNLIMTEWQGFGPKLRTEPLEIPLSASSHPWLRQWILTAFSIP